MVERTDSEAEGRSALGIAAILLVAAVAFWALQALVSDSVYAVLSGRAPVSPRDLGPLWVSYCRPTEAELLRATGWSDPGAWLFEALGDLLSVLVALVAAQAVLGGGGVREASRLRGGVLGLALTDLLALLAAVLVFDVAYLVPPRNVVLWEVADDLGLLTASVLVAFVAHGCVGRLAPRPDAMRRAQDLLVVSAVALITVLVAGGFLTAWLPTRAGTVGPRWPLVAFVVAIEWLLLTARSSSSERSSGTGGSTLRPGLLLALPSLAFALLIAEAGARLVLVLGDYDVRAAEAATVPRASTSPGDASERAVVELSRMIRPSANPRLVYSLRPDLTQEIDIPSRVGTRFRTNSHGMRGAETALEKPPGTIRIAALGDSVTFGWGVDYAETHVAALARLLQAQDPAHRYEVLNFGVPGYNTVMERESFLELAHRFSLDLVVLTVVDNDADLPNFLQRPRNPFCLHRSFLSGLLWRVLSGRDPYAAHEILVAQSYDLARRQFSTEPGRTPIGSERLSGAENATEALRRLDEDVRAVGARLLVTLDYEDLDDDLDAGAPGPRDPFLELMVTTVLEAGIPLADARNRILDHLREQGLRSADLWVGRTDSHPNVARHQLMAEALLEPARELLAREPTTP